MHAAALPLSCCCATHAALSLSYCFTSHVVFQFHATLPLLYCLLLSSILATVIVYCYCHSILLLSYTALPLSCYFAIVILLNAVMLPCHSCCSAIIIVLCQSCCQHIPWYSLSCYTLNPPLSRRPRYGHAPLPGSIKTSRARLNCWVSCKNYDCRRSWKAKRAVVTFGKKLEIVCALDCTRSWKKKLCKKLLARNS